MNVSVVVPSSLRQHHPNGPAWWSYAVSSVRRQAVKPIEIILALDPGKELFPELIEVGGIKFRTVCGDVKGHQSASNAGVKAAESPVVAFLEDDDSWEPWHLEQSLAVMEREKVDLVTNSQRLVNPEGEQVEGSLSGPVFHFPTASGWVFRREPFLTLGGFDVRFKIHHDNEFLGRWNRAGLSRCHVADGRTGYGLHPWLENLGHFSPLVAGSGKAGHWIPSVRRTVHPGQIVANPGEQSTREYAALEVMYGTVPW